MTNSLENLEFNVLGYPVRFKPDEDLEHVSPKEVVAHVLQEVDALQSSMPGLEKNKMLVLLALKLAEDRLVIEKEFKQSVEKFNSIASDALQYIEDSAPKIDNSN